MILFNTTLNKVILNKYLFVNLVNLNSNTSCQVYDITDINNIKFIGYHEVLNCTFNKLNTMAFNYFKKQDNYASIGIYQDDEIKQLEKVIKALVDQNYQVFWKNEGYKVMNTKCHGLVTDFLNSGFNYCKLQDSELCDCFVGA